MGLITFFPLLLLKLSLVFVVTWVELAKSAVYVHSRLAWKTVIWMVALLSLPFRLLTAIGRERQLEMEARYLQSALEAVAWERTYLRRRLKTMEHDRRDAIARIHLLQEQIRETKRKRSTGVRAAGDDDEKTLRARVTRETAFTQSMFSAVLSLWVGTVMWEAEQRCMPLIVALFAVVVMSLKTVLAFFSTLKTKPASNAAALLSLNCFILGLLTYPTLPILAPLGQRLLYNAAMFLPFSSLFSS